MRDIKTNLNHGAVLVLALAAIGLTAEAVFTQIRVGGVTITLPEKTGRKGKIATAESAKPAPTPTRRASSDPWVDIMLDELKKKQAEVEAFDPASPNRAFEVLTPYWIPVAVSRKARQEYFRRNGGEKAAEREAALTPALDALSAAAGKTLPLFRPNPSVFAYRNAAAEKMAVQGIRNAKIIVHKTGFEEVNWLIEKNALGIPLNRYKHGYIWARDGTDDHPYCHLYVIYLQQDYMGGGLYGQAFTKIRDNQIVGCP